MRASRNFQLEYKFVVVRNKMPIMTDDSSGRAAMQSGAFTNCGAQQE